MSKQITDDDVGAACRHLFVVNPFAGLTTAGDMQAALDHRLHLTTMVVLVMTNGHRVVGVSHCADPDQFDAATGVRLATANAKEQVRELLHFLQCERSMSVQAASTPPVPPATPHPPLSFPPGVRGYERDAADEPAPWQVRFDPSLARPVKYDMRKLAEAFDVQESAQRVGPAHADDSNRRLGIAYADLSQRFGDLASRVGQLGERVERLERVTRVQVNG